jgi:hypothetical protein
MIWPTKDLLGPYGALFPPRPKFPWKALALTRCVMLGARQIHVWESLSGKPDDGRVLRFTFETAGW